MCPVRTVTYVLGRSPTRRDSLTAGRLGRGRRASSSSETVRDAGRSTVACSPPLLEASSAQVVAYRYRDERNPSYEYSPDRRGHCR